MIVARTLQVIGADLEVETSPDGVHKPDFRATFPGGSIIVEATAPMLRPDVQEEMGQKGALVSIIERLVPSGWGILVHRLPSLGPTDSKKEFRRVAAKLLAVPPPQDDQRLRVSGIVGEEVIDMTLIPKEDGARTILGGPAHGFWGNSVDSIKKSVRRKRQQVRDSGCPVVLAVKGSEVFSSINDFEQALFGCEREYVDPARRLCRAKFVTDGVLNPRGNGRPTYAGVLAYLDVGYYCSHNPVFFLHPRFKGELPNEFRQFEWRTMESGSGISVLPSKDGRLLQRLEPVRI